MTRKLLLLLAIVTVYPVANSFAATIPAGTTLTVTTVSLITSKDVVGRSFEAKIAQDVSIKGNVLLKAGRRVQNKVNYSISACRPHSLSSGIGPLARRLYGPRENLSLSLMHF